MNVGSADLPHVRLATAKACYLAAHGSDLQSYNSFGFSQDVVVQSPLALRAFHDLRSRDVGHLPSSHLKGFSSLARAADTEAAVRAAIESAKGPA